MKLQVIYRVAEICSQCGAVNPFRKRRTVVVNGERRVYLSCRACGAHAVAVMRQPKKRE